MSSVHTSIVGAAHPYTRSESPWIIGEYHSVYGKLIHYISGGGMRTFGRTVKQEEVRRRQRRFLIAAGCLVAVWLVFYLY